MQRKEAQMGVLVYGMNGLPLMPTTERKARKLLKEGKAETVRKRPFTIKLLYKTGSTTQRIRRGVDTGSQHIGIAVTRPGDNDSEAEVIIKTEITLRTTMEKRKLTETRKEYRRGRRYRKTRYRKPKFKYKTKRRYHEKPDSKGRHWRKEPNTMQAPRPDGWLPPSVEAKVQHHIEWIKRFDEALPDPEGVIEVARFDMARMKDPSIHGEMYQKGPMYDYENVRAYVFARDNYKCRICGAKAGAKRKDGTVVKLTAQHLDYKSKGSTDNPDRQITVCDACHTGAEHAVSGKLHDLMLKNKTKAQGMRDQTFMNILRKRLFEAFPEDKFTYGNITKVDREALGLSKTHANDAVAISLAGCNASEIRDIETVYWQQQRKKKRSLHEANPRKGRGKPNTEAKRNDKNTKSVTAKGITYCLLDKVCLDSRIGWITGFTGNAAYVKDENDEYIVSSPKYKQVPLSQIKVLGHNNNWLLEPKAHLGKE